MPLKYKENQKQKGRPSKYDAKATPILAKALAMTAETSCDTELAKGLEISLSTLYKWKNDYPELSEAIKSGKSIVDKAVVSKLFERTQGIEFTSERNKKPMVYKGEAIVNPKTGDPLYHMIEKTAFVPPSDIACIFWLKNRQPEDWKDRREATVNISDVDDKLKTLSEEIRNADTAH